MGLKLPLILLKYMWPWPCPGPHTALQSLLCFHSLFTDPFSKIHDDATCSAISHNSLPVHPHPSSSQHTSQQHLLHVLPAFNARTSYPPVKLPMRENEGGDTHLTPCASKPQWPIAEKDNSAIPLQYFDTNVLKYPGFFAYQQDKQLCNPERFFLNT